MTRSVIFYVMFRSLQPSLCIELLNWETTVRLEVIDLSVLSPALLPWIWRSDVGQPGQLVWMDVQALVQRGRIQR